jgi:hypothetical protein
VPEGLEHFFTGTKIQPHLGTIIALGRNPLRPFQPYTQTTYWIFTVYNKFRRWPICKKTRSHQLHQSRDVVVEHTPYLGPFSRWVFICPESSGQITFYCIFAFMAPVFCFLLLNLEVVYNRVITIVLRL